MTLPSSGALSLSDLQTEFGGISPISLSEYYRGAATTENNTGVPASGAISLSDFYGAERLNGAMIIEAMESVAGSHAARGIDGYSGSTSSWSPTQTFSNNPTEGYSGSVFRAGNTNDSTFTVGSSAINYGLPTTSAIAWTQSLSSTPPGDPKINGSAAVSTQAGDYDTSARSNNGKIYRSKYRLFKAAVQLAAGSTSVSSDFYNGGSFTQVNDKGGFLVLPGDWEVAGVGADLSGSGSFTIPPKQIALLICNGNSDSDNINLMQLGTNSNLAFLLNYNAGWYDNMQAVFVGNKTESNQSLSYDISGDAQGVLNNPPPVFFKYASD